MTFSTPRSIAASITLAAPRTWFLTASIGLYSAAGNLLESLRMHDDVDAVERAVRRSRSRTSPMK
jgi:hypothetical protein